MEFIDLTAQQQRIKKKINSNIQAVLQHGQYIMGPEVKFLEDELANYVKSKHAIACASGTDALLLALMAYDIGPGDAILTTPFTFIATAEVITLLGATPIFVDIDSESFNINPAYLEKAIHAVKSTDSSIYPLPSIDANVGTVNRLSAKGIITVDLFGLPVDYDAITAIAKEHNLFIIEDAAQSFGGVYNGKKACSFGDISCTSFFPAKPLGCYGDGGMCFTDNDALAETMRSLRVHGKGIHKYDNVRIGINGRIDTLQAAILLAKFDIFPDELRLRQQVANRYTERLKLPSCSVTPPRIPQNYISTWAQYSVLAKDGEHRQQLQTKLQQSGVPTAIYYPAPLHLQTAFKPLGYRKGDFPICEDCSSRIFSLPMHPYLESNDQERIAELLTN